MKKPKRKPSDKEMLDWLQKNKPFAIFYRSAWGMWMIRSSDWTDHKTQPTLRSAIRAAMKEEEK